MRRMGSGAVARRIVVVLTVPLAACAGRTATGGAAGVGPSAGGGSGGGGPVAVSAGAALHAGFWLNLHTTLYAAARRSMRPGLSWAWDAGLPGAPLLPGVAGAERAAWDGAVAYYVEQLARRDLRTGEGMRDIHAELAVHAPEASAAPAALAAEHRRQLEAAAPVYRRHLWPHHEAELVAWIRDVAGRLDRVGGDASRRLSGLLEIPWYDDEPAWVDLTVYGRAFTTLHPPRRGSELPRPHTMIAVSDPAYLGWAGAEMTFHEAAHGRTAALRARLDEAAGGGEAPPGLWHPVMFYLVGEAWRAELAERGLAYEPYMFANGLFGGRWAPYEEPLAEHVLPYVEGRADAATAYRGLLEALGR